MNLGNLGRHTFAAPLAAFTLVAGGGIALAASGGDPAPQAVEHRQEAKPSATGKPTVKPTEDPTDEPSSDASPSPSLSGLCKAYQAGGYAASTKNGHVNPAWSALESAAGGADDVGSYCDDRLAADAAAKAARKGTDADDEAKADHPAKGPKPAKAHGADSDDDAIDSDDGGDVDSDDAHGVDVDDDSDEGGSEPSEHGRH
jgi:hypothetical protein